MASSTSKQDVHYTFYTQPYFQYPRRIHAYLLAKPLPAHVKVSLEYISFNERGAMIDPPGKPGGSIPMMRYGTGEFDLIRQSAAILAYLEEVHPRAAKPGVEDDMRGATALVRARVSETISLTEDAMSGFGSYVVNASGLFGRMGVEQSPMMARSSWARMQKKLTAMEAYCNAPILEGKWLAGTEGLSLADLCLASMVEYARDMYGTNILEGQEALQVWFERWQKTEEGRPGGAKTPPKEMSEVARQMKW